MTNDEFSRVNEDQAENSDELYQRFAFNIDKGQEPYRIDKFLMNRIEGATRNKLQQAINSGLVLVNNKEVKQNYKIKPYDQIVVYSDLSPESTVIVPENIPLNIAYEDARELAQRALQFKQERGRLPDINSQDAWEKHMAEGVAAFARHRAQQKAAEDRGEARNV